MKNESLNNTTLTLLFTGDVSLKTWADVGNLDRDIAFYMRLSRILKKVNMITYGGQRDRVYIKALGNINLIPIIWYRRSKLTLLQLLLKYTLDIYGTDVLKTNQILGSDIAVWLKKKLGKKLIVRCGYLYSYFVKQESTNERIINDAIQLEREAFLAADIGIVTSSWQRDMVIKEYNIKSEKIKVIPNYVITDVFSPNSMIEKKYDLVFVGRSHPQKNITNLLKAIHLLKVKGKSVSVLMVGGCCYDERIRQLAHHYGLDITFKGNVPSFNLPRLLNQARIFVLPSYYEGHPKSLLEAMSCGLPCIGSNVFGISDDIENKKTGYLCDTDCESIADAIETVLSDKFLMKSLGRIAREYVIKKYDIDKILEMELDVLREVVAG